LNHSNCERRSICFEEKSRVIAIAIHRISFFLAITIVLCGCSQLKFLYSFSGEAIKSKASYFLDLDETEESALEAEVDELVDWHRAQMLPHYASFLHQIADHVDAGPIGEAFVRSTIDGFRSLMTKTVEGATPFISNVLFQHTTPAKLAHLRTRMEERLKEHRAELEEPQADRISIKTEKTNSWFERLFGNFTPAQTKLTRGYFEKSENMAAVYLDAREKRWQAFLTFLGQNPTPEEIQQFISIILLQSEIVIGHQYKQLSQMWWTQFTYWIVEISVSLSLQQRRHFTQVLRSYAADMTELSN